MVTQATDIDLIDNNSSAISFDANGKAGILEIITTNSSESVNMSGNIDVNGTANLDVVDIDGAMQLDATLTVGTDGSGQDVVLYSGTAGDNLTWDASEEVLIVTGTNGQTAVNVADGNLVVADAVDIEGDIDVNGTANLDVVDIDGAMQLDATLTVGADGSGQDVVLYSGTAGDNLTWDASEEVLIVTGTNGQTAVNVADGNLVVADAVDIEGNIDVNGTANLDVVDIDGAMQLDATLTVGTDGSGQDVVLYSGTAGDNLTWDASEEVLIVTGTNGQTAVNVADGNLVVADAVDIEGNIDVNGTANLDVVDIDGAMQLDATLTVGTDGSGQDVVLYSGTAGDNLTWDASEEVLIVTGTNGQTAVNVADGNLVVADVLDANGSSNFNGTVSLDGSSNELRFYEGSNYVGFEAPSLSGDQIWVLPTADGSSDQVLSTNGSGTLSWSDVSATTVGTLTGASPLVLEGSTSDDFETTLSVTDPTADRTLTFPNVNGTFLTTGNMSSITTTGTVTSGEWTGTAIADAYVANDLTISGGSIDNTVIGASSKAAASVTSLNANGTVSLDGSSNELRFYEGANYVGFEAPSLGGDQIWVLPASDGTSNQGVIHKWKWNSFLGNYKFKYSNNYRQ